MDPAVEIDYLRGIHNLTKVSPMARWCLFGGSGIAALIYRSLTKVWKHLYGIDIVVHTKLVVEKSHKKQAFYRSQHGADYFMTDTVSECASESAKNQNSLGAEKELLPPCLMWDMGVPCTSRTPQSSKAKQNLGCVQQ